jgi:predicted P-loop ATPase
MIIIIGVDFHSEYQEIASVNTDTGECQEKRLAHPKRLRVVTKNSPISEKKSGSDWTDHDDSLTAAWLQHQGVLVSSKTAAEAVQVVAHDNSFHPVREYLETLKHDGKPRIDNWLPRYLGTESTV